MATTLTSIPQGKVAGSSWSSIRRLSQTVLPPLAFCVLLLCGWEIMARALHSPLIPRVGPIFEEVFALARTGDGWREIWITLVRIVSGLFFASAVSLLLGVLSARNRMMAAFLQPGIVLGLAIPGLVWALLCVIWFGVSWLTPVVALALGVAPALTVQVEQGIRSIDNSLVEMAEVYRVGRWARIRYLWIPATTPFLLSGVRVGFSLAWKIMVLVEIFGMSSGIGYQLNSEFSTQNVAGVLAWTILFGIVMLVIEYGILQTIEHRLTRWRRTKLA